MSSLTITTAPLWEPVTLDEAKDSLRVTSTDDDDYIIRCIRAARFHTEQDIRLTLPQTTYTLYMDGFPVDDILSLPMGPVISVTSIKYYDSNNALQTWDSSNYYSALGAPVSRIQYANSWPTTYEKINAVEIEYIAGWDDINDIPENLKEAILLMVGHMYENRQAVSVVMGTLNAQVTPMGYDALVQPFRIYNDRRYVGR